MERLKAEFLQDPTIEAMGNYMTRLARRQMVVSSNIANADVPGYKTQEISFNATMEELLSGPSSGMKATRPEHLGAWSFTPAEPLVFEEPGLPSRPDRNNVDMDHELLKLGRTSFGFATMAQLLRSKLRMIGFSINEGRSGA
jgi:flagellar basal-body rod protein FlgB